jgi:hypothetical protein
MVTFTAMVLVGWVLWLVVGVAVDALCGNDNKEINCNG